jgi:hypothetical protein
MSGIGWVLQVLALVIVGSAFVLGMMYDQIRLELAVAAGGGVLFLVGRWLQGRATS